MLVAVVAASVVSCSLVVKDPVQLLGRGHDPGAPALSRADAIAELDALAGLIDRVHPDPYRFHPRTIVDAERRRLIETMPASLTRIELCLRMSRLIATMDDGHTGVSCERLAYPEWEKAAKAAPPETQKLRVFAPFMRVDDQKHLIVQWPNDVPGIASGDRLLRVNGQDADVLLAEWAREISHDTEAGRLARVARTYRVQLDMHGINAPYRVTVAAPGASGREVTVLGAPVNYIFQPPPPAAPATPAQTAPATTKPTELRTAFFNYRMARPGIGYMDFFSLVGDSLLSTSSSFKDAVGRMFRQVAVDKPRVLIVDVRENGGGDDVIAEEFFRYITEKPFRLLTGYRVKRSREVRDAGKSVIRIPFRWMGLPLLVPDVRDYYLGNVGSLSARRTRTTFARPRGEPFFDGPVCVLTGPQTYSAGAEFADAAKAFGLATIVGEETGGQPNSFGNPLPLPLKRSGLAVQIATATSERANGDVTDFKPVIPDIIVRPTAADYRTGFDPVFERAVNDCPPRTIR